MKKLIIFLGVFLFGFFDDKLYDLMYKSFIYNKDLKNAYDVAVKALRYEKNSIKWRRRVADTSLWLGKSMLAYKNYMYLYKKTKDKRIENILLLFPFKFKELIKLKIKKYTSEFKEGNFAHTIDLANIYYSLGYVKKAENILKEAYEKTKYKKFFDMYIKYALMAEDMDVLKENLNKLKKDNLKQKIEIAYILINDNDFKDAYELLVYVREIPKNKEYYKLLVYVTYQLRKFDKLLRLLNYMYKNNLMDKSSFSLLLSYYYSVKDYKKLEYLLKDAINKFHYNVYKDYIDVLISNENYKKALEFLQRYKNKFSIKDYFKLKAYLYAKLKKYNLAAKFYEKLLKFNLDKNDLNEILWFSIDTKDYSLFKKIKEKIKDHCTLALAYLSFYKVDMAYYEMLKVKLNSLDKYLTFINILEIKGKNSYKYRLEAFKLANKMLQKNPFLIRKREFLKNYINLSFYFLLPNEIKKLFKIAEKILPKQEFMELKISYYFKLKEYDKLFYIKHYKREF